MYLACKEIAARTKDELTGSGGGDLAADRVSLTMERTARLEVSSVGRFFFDWLKSFRRIQTRYDRLASIYLGFLQLGCVMMVLIRRVFR
jgi:hypothetical protein